MPPFLKSLTEALGAVIGRHPRAPRVAACTAAHRSAPDVRASDVQVEGNEIQFQVSFGGGCEPHAFRLCWDGAFLESFPVQYPGDGAKTINLSIEGQPGSGAAYKF